MRERIGRIGSVIFSQAIGVKYFQLFLRHIGETGYSP